MQTIDVNIGKLIPYDKNPRKNDQSVDKVANSINHFGFRVPLVIDKNNVIVCGHTRYKAAKAQMNKGKIIAFSGGNKTRQSTASDLWDFREERERVDRLEKAVEDVKGLNAQRNLALSLRRQDAHITTVIDQEKAGQNDVKGDINELITLRRRIRQAQSKLRKKRGM